MHFIVSHPISCLIATLGAYSIALWLQKLAGGHGLLNPVVIAIALVVVYISLLGIDYAVYMKGAELIHFMLGPATVALAIPLYKKVQMLRRQAMAIAISTSMACFISGFVSWFIARQMGAGQAIQLSIITKSVTSPIAIGIAEKIGAIPSMAVFFVFTTGILGSLFAPLVFKMVRMEDERSIGFSLGVTCHGLGVAKAFQRGETAGTFAVLGMSLMGLVSGVFLPSAVLLLAGRP